MSELREFEQLKGESRRLKGGVANLTSGKDICLEALFYETLTRTFFADFTIRFKYRG